MHKTREEQEKIYNAATEKYSCFFIRLNSKNMRQSILLSRLRRRINTGILAFLQKRKPSTLRPTEKRTVLTFFWSSLIAARPSVGTSVTLFGGRRAEGRFLVVGGGEGFRGRCSLLIGEGRMCLGLYLSFHASTSTSNTRISLTNSKTKRWSLRKIVVYLKKMDTLVKKYIYRNPNYSSHLTL